MTATETTPGTLASPEGIVATATGFMVAKQLFIASEIGLFEALADGPLAVAELAERTRTPARSVRILADAMVGAGFLGCADGRYENRAAAATYLAGSADGFPDLRGFLRFWNAVSYPHWRSFEQAVRGAAPAELAITAEVQSLFAGLASFTETHALMLCEHYDFGEHARLLDIDGMSLAFPAAALARNPSLEVTYFNSPDAVAELAAEAAPYGDRLQLVGADVLADPAPSGFDLVMLAHVIHRHGAEDNLRLLGSAREAASDGARLLVVDFVLDPGGERGLDAQMAGEYLVVDGTVVYPEDEVRGWLEQTGWRWLETLTLPGSPRALVAERAA